MLILEAASVCSTETRFHGENVWNIEFSEHSDSLRRVLVLAHGKSAVVETEKITEFREDIGEDSRRMGCILHVVTIHKNVFAP